MKFSIDEINDVLMFKKKIPMGLVNSLDGTNSVNERQTIRDIAKKMAGVNADLKNNFKAWRRWAYLAKVVDQL